MHALVKVNNTYLEHEGKVKVRYAIRDKWSKISCRAETPTKSSSDKWSVFML